MREIANENVQDAHGPQECSYIREIAAWAPVHYLRDMTLVGNATVRRAPMTYDTKLLCAEDRLEARECAAGVLHVLYDAVDVLHVLPYEATDAGVFVNRLESAVWLSVIGGGSLDWDIVGERHGDVGDLGL